MGRGRMTKKSPQETFIKDPEHLPEFTPEVVEGEVVEELVGTALVPTASAMVSLPPMKLLNESNDIVRTVREVLRRVPVTETDYIEMAHDVLECARQLNIQKRLVDILLGEIGIVVRQHRLWHYVGQHCESEAHFWELCHIPVNKVNQNIAMRGQVVPMLQRAQVEEDVLEELHPMQTTALIKLAKKDNQRPRPPADLREQIVNITAAPISDLIAMERMERKADDKLPVALTLTPKITTSGTRFYEVSGQISEEQARALSEHNYYWVFSVAGETVNIAQLGEQLQHWEKPIASSPSTEVEFEVDDDDIDWDLSA